MNVTHDCSIREHMTALLKYIDLFTRIYHSLSLNYFTMSSTEGMTVTCVAAFGLSYPTKLELKT